MDAKPDVDSKPKLEELNVYYVHRLSRSPWKLSLTSQYGCSPVPGADAKAGKAVKKEEEPVEKLSLKRSLERSAAPEVPDKKFKAELQAQPEPEPAVAPAVREATPEVKDEPDAAEPNAAEPNMFDLKSLNLNRPSASDRAALTEEGVYKNSDFATIFGGNCKTVRLGSIHGVPGCFIRQDSNLFWDKTYGTGRIALQGEPLCIFGGRNDIKKPMTKLRDADGSCPIWVSLGNDDRDWIFMGYYKVAEQRVAKTGEFKAANMRCQDHFFNTLGRRVTNVETVDEAADMDDFLTYGTSEMQVFAFSGVEGRELDMVRENRRMRLGL
ncbi:hypothetical protein RQP46_005447 [Phenoliferia psychrophenolica]